MQNEHDFLFFVKLFGASLNNIKLDFYHVSMLLW